MGRVPRHRLGPGVFHVMNRGINGAWILETDADKMFLRDILVRFKEDFAVNVYHRAVMSSHFHLAAETVSMSDLSAKRRKQRREYAAFLLDEDEALQDETVFGSARTVVGDDAFMVNTRREDGRSTSRGRGRRRSLGNK